MQGFQKYIVVFLITCGIFASGWYLSSYINNKKINQIKDIQNKIAVDILSSETQFALLEELSCQDVDNSILSKEIADLAGKISYSEQNVGNQSEVQLLKKQYTILQVKDFLLSKRIRERCGEKTNTIFYFYATKMRVLTAKNRVMCSMHFVKNTPMFASIHLMPISIFQQSGRLPLSIKFAGHCQNWW